MSNYQERFEEEILKIGVSKVANTMGVARNTIYNWIANGNVPLNMLISLQGLLGINIQYIITGTHSAKYELGSGINQAAEQNPGYAVLNKREAALLENYRHISNDEGKRTIEQVASLASKTYRTESPTMKKHS